MRIGRLCVFAGAFAALSIAIEVLAAPSIHDPGGGGLVIAMAKAIDLDRAEADFKASIIVLEAIDPASDHMPIAGDLRVADLTADGLDVTKRLNQIVNGGRVKSAAWLTVSPASRRSARV